MWLQHFSTFWPDSVPSQENFCRVFATVRSGGCSSVSNELRRQVGLCARSWGQREGHGALPLPGSTGLDPGAPWPAARCLPLPRRSETRNVSIILPPCNTHDWHFQTQSQKSKCGFTAMLDMAAPRESSPWDYYRGRSCVKGGHESEQQEQLSPHCPHAVPVPPHCRHLAWQGSGYGSGAVELVLPSGPCPTMPPNDLK